MNEAVFNLVCAAGVFVAAWTITLPEESTLRTVMGLVLTVWGVATIAIARQRRRTEAGHDDQ